MNKLKWLTGAGALVLFALAAFCMIKAEWALWRHWHIDGQLLNAWYLKTLNLTIGFAACLICFVLLVIADHLRASRQQI